MASSPAAQVRRPTIKDVAALAGVSHQTVSRFFRRPEGLKPKTLERVEAAVAELGFRPSAIARSMRTRRTERIVIVLPALTTYIPLGVLSGATAAAAAAGYAVEVLVLSANSEHARERIAELASGGQVDGILSLAAIDSEDATPFETQPGDAPILVVGEYDREMHAVGTFAEGSTAGDIVHYLAARGHKHLAHVAGPADWPSARNRREHFARTVAELGLPEPLIIESDWSIRGGYEAAAALPDPLNVTAIFAANDRIAMGVMTLLRERGLKVPADVSVVGWDDDPMSEFLDPPLTTVRIDSEQEGRRAVAALLHQIDPSIEEQVEYGPPDKLIQRKSVATIRPASSAR